MNRVRGAPETLDKIESSNAIINGRDHGTPTNAQAVSTVVRINMLDGIQIFNIGIRASLLFLATTLAQPFPS